MVQDLLFINIFLIKIFFNERVLIKYKEILKKIFTYFSLMINITNFIVINKIIIRQKSLAS